MLPNRDTGRSSNEAANGRSMASLMQGLFGGRNRGSLLRPTRALGRSGRRVLLRGASKRAYSFEILDRDEPAALAGVGAVYVYARRIAGVSRQPGFRDDAADFFHLSYIGRTADMAGRDAEHDRLGHFAGHGLDIVLLSAIVHETIRAEIAADLLDLHRPALNELIHGRRPDSLS